MSKNGKISNGVYKTYKWDKDAFRIFSKLIARKNLFFLDSGMNLEGLGRYSFIGFDPAFILKSEDRQNPFHELRNTIDKYKLPEKLRKLSPFLCGLCGYLSYDLGFVLEDVKKHSIDDLRLPTSYFGFYDTVITIDHLKKELLIFSSGLPETKSQLAKLRAGQRFKEILTILSSLEDNKQIVPEAAIGKLESNFNRSEYIKAIDKAKEYISCGDIYQINLSQRFKAECNIEGAGLYHRLRRIFPSAFSAYLDCGGFKILSSSPERFLQVTEKSIITRPMKGTRPRGRVDSEDELLKDELLNSEKDKAELLMIVDLERNDLGRVCEYSSVRVTQPRVLETYSTVFQTTSQVEGKLHKDKDRIDLIKACFPGGSITGCPKIRAMEIIEGIEPNRRNIYTGALGYFDLAGGMDFNILIRTMLLKERKVYFNVGGGIVADSVPELEFDETLVKAKAMFRALGVNNGDISRRQMAKKGQGQYANI